MCKQNDDVDIHVCTCNQMKCIYSSVVNKLTACIYIDFVLIDM